MSVLKKARAVPKREVAQVAKKAHLSLRVIQIDYNAGDDEHWHKGCMINMGMLIKAP